MHRQNQNQILSNLVQELNNIGLNQDQLAKQNLAEIRSSLTLLNICIKRPFSFLGLDSGNPDRAGAECRADIVEILLKLKRLALMRYDILVNREKCGKIRQIIKKIKDREIQSAIENSLYQLELKDQIVKKEYLKLDQVMTLPALSRQPDGCH
jgi:hypothetical protein